jgi:hypothetical protein
MRFLEILNLQGPTPKQSFSSRSASKQIAKLCSEEDGEGIGDVSRHTDSGARCLSAFMMLVVLVAATFFGVVDPYVAHADPAPGCATGEPSCTGPDREAARKQCALHAWVMGMPCYWDGRNQCVMSTFMMHMPCNPQD